MGSPLFLRFRVSRADSKNSNPKFTRERQIFHYTFLFDAYETKISHRGRKKLRYWLFQAAKSAVSHSAEFKTLHMYYTTRADNPLKKMQSLIVIACKILRVIYAILKHGTEYDPEKMMKGIKHPAAGRNAVV